MPNYWLIFNSGQYVLLNFHGIIKRHLEIPARQKEMVAGTLNNCFAYYWAFNYTGKQFRIGSLYLYLVLMPDEHSNKSYQTVIVFILLLGTIFWFTRNTTWLIGAFLLGAITLVFPFIADLLNNGWTKLGLAIGKVMNLVLLTLVFVVVVIPLGWLSRRLGKNSIQNIKKNGSSYFKDRSHRYTKEDIENPWWFLVYISTTSAATIPLAWV